MNTKEIKLPPMPLAFFDEFGNGADDRVQDYARDAVRLNAQGVPDGMVLVNRGALNVVVNALRRDAEQGREVRGEMADMLSAAPAPQPAQQPLTDEQIFDSWEFITGHQIQFGPRNEGRPMFISTDEVLEFARAIEASHGIGKP